MGCPHIFFLRRCYGLCIGSLDFLLCASAYVGIAICVIDLPAANRHDALIRSNPFRTIDGKFHYWRLPGACRRVTHPTFLPLCRILELAERGFHTGSRIIQVSGFRRSHPLIALSPVSINGEKIKLFPFQKDVAYLNLWVYIHGSFSATLA